MVAERSTARCPGTGSGLQTGSSALFDRDLVRPVLVVVSCRGARRVEPEGRPAVSRGAAAVPGRADSGPAGARCPRYGPTDVPAKRVLAATTSGGEG